MKAFCNSIYSDLMARLGELSLEKERVEREIEAIKNQVQLLNAMAPKLEAKEKEGK